VGETHAWYRPDGCAVFPETAIGGRRSVVVSRHFGTLDSPPNQGAGRKSPLGYPEVYIVSNVLEERGKPIGALGDGGVAWHSDISYAAQPPA
jgi:taurine dioxygenase